MSINRQDNIQSFDEKKAEQLHESLLKELGAGSKTLSLNLQNKRNGDIYDKVELLLYALRTNDDKLGKTMLATLYKVEYSSSKPKAIFNPIALRSLEFVWQKNPEKKMKDQASLKKLFSELGEFNISNKDANFLDNERNQSKSEITATDNKAEPPKPPSRDNRPGLSSPNTSVKNAKHEPNTSPTTSKIFSRGIPLPGLADQKEVPKPKKKP